SPQKPPTQTVSTQKSVFPKTGKTPLSPSFFSKKNAPCPQKSPKNTYIFSAFDTSRPRQMIDIQYSITIMGGREVSRPYQVGFCFCAPRIYPLNLCMGELVGKKKKLT
ncbi:MAG: hypothetical protein SPE55_04310, partial [Sodaliphilus sp.]|nr:hypothetical protein [Sodaliphilus sp.]